MGLGLMIGPPVGGALFEVSQIFNHTNPVTSAVAHRRFVYVRFLIRWSTVLFDCRHQLMSIHLSIDKYLLCQKGGTMTLQ